MRKLLLMITLMLWACAADDEKNGHGYLVVLDSCRIDCRTPNGMITRFYDHDGECAVIVHHDCNGNAVEVHCNGDEPCR